MGAPDPNQTEPLAVTDFGGQYQAAQASDGKWTVYGVELFAAHVDTRLRDLWGEPNAPAEEYDRAFLERVIQRHASRFDEGYLAPLHVRHHGWSDTEEAGFFLPRTVERRTYEGLPLDVLVGELVGVHPDAYARIRDARVPYRSVEVDPEHAEILSLALLPDEVPFFRFPLLTIGDETPHPEAGPSVVRLAARARPAVAWRRGCQGAPDAVLFSFAPRRYGMPDDENKPDEKAEGGSDLEAAKAKMAEAMTALTGLLEEVGAKIREAVSGLGVGGEGEPAASGPVEMGSGGRKAKPAGYAASAEYAQMAGKMAGLEAQVADLVAQKVQAERYAAALEDLEATPGIRVTAQDRADIRSFSAMGEPQLKGWLESRKRFRVREQPSPFTGELLGRDFAPDELPAEVLTYREKGPDVFARAKELAVQWANAPGSRRTTLESYLRANIGHGEKAGVNGRVTF